MEWCGNAAAEIHVSMNLWVIIFRFPGNILHEVVGVLGGHYEFLKDSVLLVVGVLVGMMIHVIGGEHISGYQKWLNIM